MASTRLTRESRQAALEAMADDEGLDVLVIGGGVTGAGIALDAATRGLRTGIVEARDWSQGTSSRSSKLVHGGLRYLYQLDFKLVAEALKERGLLLTTIAPHLVKAQPFLWPLRTPVIERAYSAIGVGLYDALAVIGAHGRTVPLQKHYSRKGAKQLFPGIREDALCGAIRFYDARVDDSRLVIDLVRTAAGLGTLAASRTELTELVKDADGRVVGAVLTDLETGATHRVRTRHVINATGVWTQQTQRLGGKGGLKVLASKGIHILVPRERIDATTGIFLRTEKSVLFIIPWQRYWVIGTTDTAWHEDLAHPVATSADIDYILEHANAVLADPLTRDDIIGTFAGLRPLLQPGTMDESQSTKISREHTVTQIAPGLVSIAGGKLTTYRVMAEDAVDFVLGKERAKALPSRTTSTPLVGAPGLAEMEAQADRIAQERGWTAARLEHLLGRYGAELPTLLAMIDQDPALGEPLPEAPAYLGVEVAFAVTYEGALHLEDIVNHRVRLAMETPDRGISALPGITVVAAELLGWDDATRAREIASYEAQARAELEAERQATDTDAVSARLRADDLRPVLPLGVA